VAAVDAQYTVSGIEFRRSIPSVTSKPVTHLLLTHYHGDHVFGNQAFEDCEIVAHRLLKEKMEENLRTVWALGNIEKMIEEVRVNKPERARLYEGLRIVLPTKTFDERFTIDGVEMTHMGGHSHGPLCDKSEIETQLEWFEAVRGEVKRLIADGASIEGAVKHDGYPSLYEPEREGRADDTLRHWFRFWSESR